MPRKPTSNLPAIAVRDETVKLSLVIPVELNADLEQYAAYYQSRTGKPPTSQDAVVVGLLTTFLSHDADFQAWKGRGARSAESATPTPRRTTKPSGAAAGAAPGANSNGHDASSTLVTNGDRITGGESGSATAPQH